MRPPLTTGPQDVVLPAYGSGSLVDVVPSALAALGVDGWSNVLALPAASSYVVLLVDGLGWNLLRRHRSEAPYLSSLTERGRAITSGVPSTTATSLTSIGTGLPPGTHGVVGFTSRVPGTNRLLDALRWDSRVDPREWQPHPTAFERAALAGVAVNVVSKRMFENSGLTRAGQRGATYLGADLVGEKISTTVRAASVPGSFTYVYDGELDTTGHRHGCESWSWKYQLAMVDGFARTLRSALPSEATLVVVADHGMVDIAMERRVDVDEEQDLRLGVSLIGGEARFRHLYCESGAVEDVVARWHDRLGESALVLARDPAIETGWFGAVEPAVRPRLGDVIVASVGDVAVMSSERFPHEATLVGLHGSVTADEMLVPLLVDVSV
ncbi:MAG: alkaline phosphatase family protein [Actinomycetota bacterium]|nr:alkaline phosphatase family protein [Actinomycetota bacterium]